MPRAIRLADRVICVSRATARDAVGLLDVPESRLRVCRTAIDAVFSSRRARAASTARTSCSSGRRSRARTSPRDRGRFTLVRRAGRPVRLVLVGRRRLGRRARRARPRASCLGACDDATLRDLYAHAGASPARRLWEGFGLAPARRSRRLPGRLLRPPGAARGRRRGRDLLRPVSAEAIAGAPSRRSKQPRSHPASADDWDDAAARSSRVARARPVSRSTLVLVDADTVGRGRTGDEATPSISSASSRSPPPSWRFAASSAIRSRCPTTCRVEFAGSR